MTHLEIITIGRLKEAVETSAKDTKKEFPNSYFGHAGIMPVEDDSFRYECTPINTKVFGMTGGDGVHYSILEISGSIQPVVMTVPMIYGNSPENYNWILGENLNEFLSLGYYNGWFPLEQLAYDVKWALEYYSKGVSKDQSEAEALFLLKLRESLKYKHVPLNIERINQLKELYFNELEFDREFFDQLNEQHNL